MQSPIAGLMGLVGRAVGNVPKAPTRSGHDAGFDEQLSRALGADTKSAKEILDRLVSDDGSVDGDALKELMASPQAFHLLQFMSALKSLGLSSQDAQALLLGTGDKVSDDAVGAILASCGISKEEIDRIMADPAALSDLKAELAGSVSSRMKADIDGENQDLNLLIRQATADQGTYDALISGFAAAAGFRSGLDGSAAATGATAGEASEKVQEIQAKIAAFPEGTIEIKKTIADFLKSLNGGMSAQAASESETVMAAQSVNTLEKTFGIPKKTLNDIFFSTDSAARKSAVEEATARITGFLSSHEGKALGREHTDALTFLKGSLSSEEFASIENAVKQNYPDAAIADSVPPDRRGFEVLARALGEKPGASGNQLTQQVMDQIKQAVPQNVKNGEGSISLQLNPPMLGKVDVEIHMEKGMLQAAFRADQPVTRDILQQSMHILKDSLAEQGVQVVQVSVSADVNSRHPQQNAFAWTGFQNNGHGSSRQDRGQDAGGSHGNREEYAHAPAAVGGYTETGGLDLFA